MVTRSGEGGPFEHFPSRMIPCSSIKFSRDQIGYDLRRNESISRDYNKMFSTNMYTKVGHGSLPTTITSSCRKP